jgi:hypothetical protein
MATPIAIAWRATPAPAPTAVPSAIQIPTRERRAKVALRQSAETCRSFRRIVRRHAPTGFGRLWPEQLPAPQRVWLRSRSMQDSVGETRLEQSHASLHERCRERGCGSPRFCESGRCRSVVGEGRDRLRQDGADRPRESSARQGDYGRSSRHRWVQERGASRRSGNAEREHAPCIDRGAELLQLEWVQSLSHHDHYRK